MKIKLNTGRVVSVTPALGRALLHYRKATSVVERAAEPKEPGPPKAAILGRRVVEPRVVDEPAAEPAPDDGGPASDSSSDDGDAALQEDVQDAEISERTGKPKRQYKRRDMVAE